MLYASINSKWSEIYIVSIRVVIHYSVNKAVRFNEGKKPCFVFSMILKGFLTQRFPGKRFQLTLEDCWINCKSTVTGTGRIHSLSILCSSLSILNYVSRFNSFNISGIYKEHKYLFPRWLHTLPTVHDHAWLHTPHHAEFSLNVNIFRDWILHTFLDTRMLSSVLK